MRVNSAKDLVVYKKAYNVAMEIFSLTKQFPREETYGLTDQVRQSSRSVAMNLREAWAKRRYEAHFVSKLTDCNGEKAEAETSLDFALDCGYITQGSHKSSIHQNRELGKMLGSMIKNPMPFILTPDARLLPSDA